MQLTIIDQHHISSPQQHFCCERFHAKLSARACLVHQKVAAGPGSEARAFNLCVGCQTGSVIRRRVNSNTSGIGDSVRKKQEHIRRAASAAKRQRKVNRNEKVMWTDGLLDKCAQAIWLDKRGILVTDIAAEAKVRVGIVTRWLRIGRSFPERIQSRLDLLEQGKQLECGFGVVEPKQRRKPLVDASKIELTPGVVVGHFTHTGMRRGHHSPTMVARANEAERLRGLGLETCQIAEKLGVHSRQVTEWARQKKSKPELFLQEAS